MKSLYFFPSLLLSLAAAKPIAQPEPQAQTINPFATDSIPPLPAASTFESSLRGMIALGDSYTAAPGAGIEFDENAGNCHRGINSYANTVFKTFLQRSRLHDFNFAACTGGVIRDVITTQVNSIKTAPSPEIVTISVGGNDVNFEKERPHTLSSPGSCKEVVKEATDILLSQTFRNNLRDVFRAIWASPAKAARVIVVGYPTFFNEDTSHCSSRSFGYFEKPFCTRPVRSSLNNRIEYMNWLLTDVVRQANTDPEMPDHAFAATVIDLNGRFMPPGQQIDLWAGHRLCEEGIDEPTNANPAAYLFQGLRDGDHLGPRGDVDNTGSLSGLNEQNDPPIFETVNPDTCDPNDPTDIFSVCQYAKDFRENTEIRSQIENVTVIEWTKPFHPKTQAHNALANVIISMLENNQIVSAQDALNANTAAFPEPVLTELTDDPA